MHAVVGAGLADDLLGFTEILTKPAPTAICHNFHLIWYQSQQFAIQVHLNSVLYRGMYARLRSQSDTMRLQLSTLSLPKVAWHTVSITASCCLKV